MAMVGVDSGSLYRRTHSLSRLAWPWVGGRLASFYIDHDGTINIVVNLLLLTDIGCRYGFPVTLWSRSTWYAGPG